MKPVITLFVSLLFTIVQAQENINLKNGYAAEGYDVVAYFNNKVIKGDKNITYNYKEAKYSFSSNKNFETFKKNPEMYVPQYGGYCAYAIAVNNKKVSVNPKSFQILNYKLYLFYDNWGVNTLEKWKEEGPKKLQEQADYNWKNLLKKKN